MFFEWAAHGAEIGVTAFFAVVVFLMIVAVLFGLFTVLVQIFRTEDNEDGVHRNRPRQEGRGVRYL